jgi:hypothetical protein
MQRSYRLMAAHWRHTVSQKTAIFHNEAKQPDAREAAL